MKGTTKKALGAAGSALAPKVIEMAPSATTNFLSRVLQLAINGVGTLPGAVAAADKEARETGHPEKAITSLIRTHVALAGAEGFVTNLGGLVVSVVTIPANIAGLALIQVRMLCAIAHLRGYDVHDPRVVNAILMLMLGEGTVDKKVKDRKLPGRPLAVATAPTYDPLIDQLVAAEVAAEMLAKVAGKRLAATVAKRTPVVGGFVGAGVDGWETFQVARYARKELVARRR